MNPLDLAMEARECWVNGNTSNAESSLIVMRTENQQIQLMIDQSKLCVKRLNSLPVGVLYKNSKKYIYLRKVGVMQIFHI